MVETAYFCDLCKQRKEPAELLGMRWGAYYEEIGGEGYRLTDNIKECGGRHLCRACIEAVRRYLATPTEE